MKNEHGAIDVLRSAAVVSVMTALSRALGLIREIVMAYFFGTSALKSAFDMAFLIPNLFRRLFGEGALSSAFVPVLSESIEKEGRAEAFLFASRVVSLLIMALGCITLGGVLLTYPVAELLPDNSRWILPLPMIRVMLPYAMLICVAAIFSGVLNTLGRFAISSLTPLVLNVVWIAALFLICPFVTDPRAQILWLSWAVLLAGVAQMLFQLPALARCGFHFRFHVTGIFSSQKIRRVLTLMGPAALGFGLIQINLCIDKSLAFWADVSAPAALEYAERLVYLPLGMFGTAFMTVLLPTFSRFIANDDMDGVRDTLERSMRNLAVIMAPCAFALTVLAEPIIHLIYGIHGGAFTAESTTLSARALMFYAPGLIVFCLQKVTTPAFYAMRDVITPVKVSLVALILNVVLNVSSVLLLPVGWKHVGIAGSTVICSLASGIVLATILTRRGVNAAYGRVAWSLTKACACAALMASVARGAYHLTGVAHMDKPQEILGMAVIVVMGVAVYGGLMAMTSRAEVMEMINAFRKKKQCA